MLQKSLPTYIPPQLQIDNNIHLPFFVHQLNTFEVWLLYGKYDKDFVLLEECLLFYSTSNADWALQYLPVVLQAMLSQTHRLKALQVLAQYCDLNEWCVRQVLSVGFIPYLQVDFWERFLEETVFSAETTHLQHIGRAEIAIGVYLDENYLGRCANAFRYHPEGRSRQLYDFLTDIFLPLQSQGSGGIEFFIKMLKSEVGQSFCVSVHSLSHTERYYSLL